MPPRATHGLSPMEVRIDLETWAQSTLALSPEQKGLHLMLGVAICRKGSPLTAEEAKQVGGEEFLRQMLSLNLLKQHGKLMRSPFWDAVARGQRQRSDKARKNATCRWRGQEVRLEEHPEVRLEEHLRKLGIVVVSGQRATYKIPDLWLSKAKDDGHDDEEWVKAEGVSFISHFTSVDCKNPTRVQWGRRFIDWLHQNRGRHRKSSGTQRVDFLREAQGTQQKY